MEHCPSQGSYLQWNYIDFPDTPLPLTFSYAHTSNICKISLHVVRPCHPFAERSGHIPHSFNPSLEQAIILVIDKTVIFIVESKCNLDSRFIISSLLVFPHHCTRNFRNPSQQNPDFFGSNSFPIALVFQFYSFIYLFALACSKVLHCKSLQEHFNEETARRSFTVMPISRNSKRLYPMVNTVTLLGLELDTDALDFSKDQLSSRVGRYCVECGLPISLVFLHCVVV